APKGGLQYTAAQNAPSMPADVAKNVHAIIGLQPFRKANKNFRICPPRRAVTMTGRDQSHAQQRNLQDERAQQNLRQHRARQLVGLRRYQERASLPRPPRAESAANFFRWAANAPFEQGAVGDLR